MHWSGALETVLNDSRKLRVKRKGDTMCKKKQQTGEGQGRVDVLLRCAELLWQEYTVRQRNEEENVKYCSCG